MARRLVVAVVGTTVVIAGVVLMALPGPGLLTVLVGLGILSAEFAFARRWIQYLKARSDSAASAAGIPRSWRWVFPAMAVAITLAAMALPLFVAVVRTSQGWRLVHKPAISYRYSWTSSEELLDQAQLGDDTARALLHRADPSTATAPPVHAP
jgi:tellurite resistance protein TerC